MAFRAAANLKSKVINGCLQGTSNFTTSASPKLKAYAPTLDNLLHPPNHIKARLGRGDFVPVCVAIGMIVVSSSLGIYTGLRELREAPNVFVRKSRRETIPEVVEPEHVVEDSLKFINHSLFRKVAHIKNGHQQDTANCIYATRPKVETLKDIGLDPKV